MENLFFVGSQGGKIIISKPCQKLTKEEAVNLSAWLIALTCQKEKFDKAHEEICNI